MTRLNHFCPTAARAGCTSKALMLRFRLVIVGNSEAAFVYEDHKDQLS